MKHMNCPISISLITVKTNDIHLYSVDRLRVDCDWTKDEGKDMVRPWIIYVNSTLVEKGKTERGVCIDHV